MALYLADDSRLGVEAEIENVDLEQLIKAASNGDISTLRSLLARGVDPNQVPEEGLAPLHAAVENLQIDALNTLLAAGADANLRGRGLFTPLFHAVDIACDTAAQRGDSFPDPDGLHVIAALLRVGADPNLVCHIPRGDTLRISYPARLAREYAQNDLAELLEEAAGEKVRELLNRITVQPDQMAGKPCIRGQRKQVVDVLRLMARGLSREEVIEQLPELQIADIRACLEYACRTLDSADPRIG